MKRPSAIVPSSGIDPPAHYNEAVDLEKTLLRKVGEAVGRFMSAMAGNLPGYEEASRALYANNRPRFEELILHWPHDIRAYVKRQAEDAFHPKKEA